MRDALRDGFGVDPGRVVQNGYEPLQYDENGQFCGSQPTLGMDVHPTLKLNKARVAETAEFFRDFVKRLECTANAGKPGLSVGSCDRPGHRLPTGNRASGEVRPARHLRPRTRARR